MMCFVICRYPAAGKTRQRRVVSGCSGVVGRFRRSSCALSDRSTGQYLEATPLLNMQYGPSASADADDRHEAPDVVERASTGIKSATEGASVSFHILEGSQRRKECCGPRHPLRRSPRIKLFCSFFSAFRSAVRSPIPRYPR